MDEIEIDLLDLCYRILKKWRVLLAAAVLGAVLLDGYGIVKLKRQIQQVQQKNEEMLKQEAETEDVEQNQLTIAEFAATLTNREKTEVDRTVAMYQSYQKQYQEVKSYYTNSIKMNLDAKAVPNLRVQYYIDTHYETIYPVIEKKDVTTALINAICVEFQDQEIYQKIAAVVGEETDSAYVPELLVVWQSGEDNLDLNVIAPDQETCEKMMEVLQEELEAMTKELCKSYGDFDCTLISEQYYEIVNNDLLNAQKTQLDTMNSLKTTCANLANTLNEDQKKYYNALLDQSDSIELQQEETEVQEEIELIPLTEPEMKYFDLKYALIGAVVGFFLACCWYGFAYLVASTLRIQSDMESFFQIMLLGTLDSDKEKKYNLAFDRWLCRIFHKENGNFSAEERMHMMCAGIRIAAQKAGVTSVYVTGSSNDEETKTLCQTLVDRLSGEIGKVQTGISVLYDPESLEALSASESVVIVEKIDASLYTDIKKELELCKSYQVPVLGSVVLR